MDKKELEQVRYMCEMNFRHTLYKDIKFKYFPSIGIKDIFQSFANENVFVGVLHLNYRKGESKKMYWHSSWFNKPEQAIFEAMCIQKEKIYDEELVMNTVQRHIRDIYHPPENFS